MVNKTLYRTLYCEYYVIDFEIIVRDSRIGKPSLYTNLLLLLPKQTITCPLIIELEWVIWNVVSEVLRRSRILGYTALIPPLAHYIPLHESERPRPD